MSVRNIILRLPKPSHIVRDLKNISTSARSHLEEQGANFEFPRLSRQQVSTILQTHEIKVDINHEAVLRFENCKLAANNPIEDRHSEGYCNVTDGYLFGVFDGHAGVANSQAVSERLFNYIAVNLLNTSMLQRFCKRIQKQNETLDLVKFLSHSSTYFNKDFADLYKDAIIKYANESLSDGDDWEQQFTMEKALQSAFYRLDRDIKQEAFPEDSKQLNTQLLTIALSGCCAVTAHIDGPHLHVANTGDCGAVLGIQNDDGSWSPKRLTIPHCVDNKAEKARLYKEHKNERGTVIKDGRVLGSVEPTRAFGDFRFKLSSEELRDAAKRIRATKLEEDSGGLPAYYYEPPQYYYSPPYLTALPEVQYHHLRPKDKFLIIASDGLWNMFPNNEAKVVQLVADHMLGAQTVSDFKLPKDRQLDLGQLNEMLMIRKSHIALRAEDSNCATHLIRNAIGQTEFGINHGKLSAMLTLPENFVRYYRDDITVTVIFFDEGYLRASLD